MSITLQDQIPSFLEYLRFEKRYSRHTLVSYETDLAQLVKYFQEKEYSLSLEELAAPILRSWLASLKEGGLEVRSINRKISALKSLYRFLLRKSLVQQNPAAQLRLMKAPRRLPAFLNEGETETLMASDHAGDGWKSLTRQLMIEILYTCGLRVSELVGLKEKQVDLRLKQLKVLGKGNKERIVPMQADLAERIGRYILEKRQTLEGADQEYLLVQEHGKRLYVKYVYREIREELQQFRTVSKKSPHLMRHTFATQLANNGADLNAIKTLLGHSSLAATQVYTHNTIDKLKDIHKKAHPKA